MRLAIAAFSLASSPIGPPEPGTQGTPAFFMALIADTLSPIRRIVSAFGPMKIKPDFSTCSAKSAFSDRKPYPGWIATAPVTSAAAIIEGTFRYDSFAAGLPIQIVSSASLTCFRSRSAVECTATVLIPSSLHARRMRSAISPRLAMTILSNIAGSLIR